MRTLLVYTHMNNPNAYPPLGVVELATGKSDVMIHDMTWDRSLEPVREAIARFRPQVLGLSVLSVSYETAKSVARLTYGYYDSAIYGGPHACAMEPSSVEVLSPYVEVKIARGPYPFNPDLVPDRTLLPTMDKYLATNPGFPYLMPWTHLIASRGCPFDCSFCQPMLRKMFGSKVRHRTVESVLTEIDQLQSRWNIKSFTFMDDTMVSNVPWLEHLCSELRKVGLPWTAQSNIKTITKDRLKMMKEAGLIFIGMGVESGSERILRDVYNKPQTVEEMKRAFALCDELGIMTEATLIIGAPEDTKETINETAQLMKEVSPDVVDLHYLTPTPGSHLYSKYKRGGVLNYKVGGTPDRYTLGLLRGNLNGRELEKCYWSVIRAWLRRKRLCYPNRWWFRWLTSLRGLSAIGEGLVRFLIYHNYTCHRVLKTLVWKWRGKWPKTP